MSEPMQYELDLCLDELVAIDLNEYKKKIGSMINILTEEQVIKMFWESKGISMSDQHFQYIDTADFGC